MGSHTITSEPFQGTEARSLLSAEVGATKPVPPTHAPDSSGKQLPPGVLPDIFCHTVGVRTPQKHLGVGKAIGNGKEIKRQYHLRSCLKAGRVSKTVIWLKSPTGTSRRKL